MGTNAHPFLMAYWLYLFNKYWQDEVDKVYICLSQPVYPRAWLYTKQLLSTNPKIVIIETNAPWPNSVEVGIGRSSEASLLINHDDLFVFKHGVVDDMFSIVENEGKVVTPIHGNYTPTFLVRELMQHKWGDRLPFVAPNGTTEYSFYCNFLFAPSNLVKKSGYFLGEYKVAIGDKSDILDWQFLSTELHADTNFLFGLQLLEAGAQFRVIPDYDFKAYMPLNADVVSTLKEQHETNTGAFADLPWLHFQTFSYHIGGLFFDMDYREMLEVTSGSKVKPLITNTPVNTVVAKNDILLKVATLKEMATVCDFAGMQKWYNHALKELDYCQKYAGITAGEMKQTRKLVAKLLKINEK